MLRGITTGPRRARNPSASATAGSWPASSCSCRFCLARCACRCWLGCRGPAHTGKIAHARQLAELIAARYPARTVHVVGDAAYVGERLRDVDARISWTSLLKVTSVLHELPPPRTGRSGRPRTRGARLGTPTDLAAMATVGARWRTTPVRRYGRTDAVQITELVCLWYGSFRSRTVRVILVRDDKPRTRDRDDRGYGLPLVTTDLESSAEDLVARYASRWGIEQAFADARQIIGVGEARNRTRRAVERTVPFGLICFSVVTVWYALHGHAPDDVTGRRTRARWYTTKTEPSYDDMTVKLRRVIIAARFRSPCPEQATPQETRAVLAAWAAPGHDQPKLRNTSQLVGAENPVTSCDLHILVHEAAEPVSSQRPHGRAGALGSGGRRAAAVGVTGEAGECRSARRTHAALRRGGGGW